MAPPTTTKDYKNFLNSITVPFPCPECQSSVLPKDFEEHYTSHGLISQRSCAWCLGKTSWRKNSNTKHLMECAARFLTVQLGRDLQPGAYEHVRLKPLSPNRMTYRPESLNIAIACLRTYLELGKRAYWAHVIVRAVDFQSFLKAMDADEGCTQTLPFSCWCDGGKDSEARHRHMIVAAPSREHFERNVWNGARPRPIKSPMQLINCMGHLSQRDADCQFSSGLKAYHVSMPLPEGYRLVLAVQWEKGLDCLLNDELNKMKPLELVQKPMERGADGKWRIRVKDILGPQLDRSFPVTEDFYPCSYPTEYFVYKLHGQKFYYDRVPS